MWSFHPSGLYLVLLNIMYLSEKNGVPSQMFSHRGLLTAGYVAHYPKTHSETTHELDEDNEAFSL